MYGFVITSLGLNYLAKLLAGQQIQISDVVVGSGRVPDGTSPALMTDLMTPERRATSTMPVVKDHTCSFIIEYRTDLTTAVDGSPLPGGNPAAFWLNEFGVFVLDPDLGRIMLYYGTLGDYPQHCAAYVGGAVDIRRYPVSIGLSADVTVVLNYPAIAWMTAQDIDLYFRTIAMQVFEAKMRELEDLLHQHARLTIATQPNGVHGHRIVGNRVQYYIHPHGWVYLGQDGKLELPDEGGDTGYGEGGYGEGGYGGVNGKYIVDENGVLSMIPNTVRFADFEDGILKFRPGFAEAQNGILILE